MIKQALMAIAVLFAGALSASAEGEFTDVLNSSYTYNQVSVASAVLVGLNGGTNQLLAASLIGTSTTFFNLMENRKVLEICNEDASASLHCLVALSSTSAAGDLSLTVPGLLTTSYGKKILPGACYAMGLRSREVDSGYNRIFIPWCVNDGGSAATKASLIQGRNK